MINILFYILALYLQGYGIGLEENGPLGGIITLSLKIWYVISGIIISIIGVIIPEISFVMSSSEWAMIILYAIGTMLIPFLIGLLFGRYMVHYRIGMKLGWKNLER